MPFSGSGRLSIIGPELAKGPSQSSPRGGTDGSATECEVQPRRRFRIVGSRQTSATQGHNLLVHHLAAAGYKVSCWSGSPSQRLVARVYRAAAECGELSPSRVYQQFLSRVHLGRLGSAETFLHFIWGDDLVAGCSHPARSVFTLHQPHEHWDESKWTKIATCAGIVCMAERERDEIRRRAPQTPVAFIPHGIDTAFWRPAASAPRCQICAVGRYLRNFGMLLRVARRLLERHPDVTFRWVVNPGFQLPPEFIPLIPPERFEILRELSAEELHRVYTESWLFFTPYDQIAGSNAIVEAMACGIPVFTTRVGGIQSYAGDGALTLADNNDDETMIAAISACLASPELRTALGVRARAHAERCFGWPVVVRAHEEFYREVQSSRRPQPGSPTARG